MEAFSLLRYWKGGGRNDGVNGGTEDCSKFRATAVTTTIVDAVAQNVADTDDEDDDDGPFVDLRFSIPDEDDNEDGEEGENGEPTGGNESDREEVGVIRDGSDDEEVEGDKDFNFTILSGSSNDRSDHSLSLSPSADFFFKGKHVPVESSSLVINSTEPDFKSLFPGSFLKSATQFWVFTLGLKKSKSSVVEKTENKSETKRENKAESKGSIPSASKEQQEKQQEKQQDHQKIHKSFTVKFKVEEVPIVSLFTRDNSSRISSSNNSENQNSEEVSPEEKRFSKETIQKYLKMVKPLYIRVSRRYGEKLRFSGKLSLNGLVPKASILTSMANQKPTPAKTSSEKSQVKPEISSVSQSNTKSQKQVNLQAGFRLGCKHLGKSRSASSAVVAVPVGTGSSIRRDEFLLQQQDGIQSAILHCKKSFHASGEMESSVRTRSSNDQPNEKAMEVSRKSLEVMT